MDSNLDKMKKDLEEFEKVILLSEDDEKWNSVAVSIVNKLQKEGKRIKVYSCFESLAVQDNIVEIISAEHCKEIMNLYRMYEFSAEFVILSYTKPFGRNWKYLLDEGCLSREEMIRSILNI